MPKTTLEQGYGGRDFNRGPTTYSDPEFYRKILSATGLRHAIDSKRVLDIMSGPGKVGQALQKLAPENNYFYLDLSETQVRKIPPVVNDLKHYRVNADVRALPIGDSAIDVAVVRYGIKDLIQEEQLGVLKDIYRILRPGGTLVIADMVSPDADGVKEWLNNHHALKQELGGRDPEKEGACYIPTRKEWLSMLSDAGFRFEMLETHVSHVITKSWVDGNQITEEQLAGMNDNIRGGSDEVKREFSVREENGLVKIDYPVIIIKAIKPDQGD